VSRSAKRLVWGKFSLNTGQTCVAPDYIITTPQQERPLIEELKKVRGTAGASWGFTFCVFAVLSEGGRVEVCVLSDFRCLLGGVISLTVRQIIACLLRSPYVFCFTVWPCCVPSPHSLWDDVSSVRRFPLSFYLVAE